MFQEHFGKHLLFPGAEHLPGASLTKAGVSESAAQIYLSYCIIVTQFKLKVGVERAFFFY